ncbi:MAG: beta-ketoacyl-ACP synthase III [Armatimonadota bacterium]|nr:beta-ketoacyl-ACP synthase III [Armatimonadota bacterium]MDR7438330.1 beta-ketoacyl-ACP synthase III [Armatimonadota bacterium]MDR7443348.1 beta-ketoacyl-ACP synthase III [Armatimonadota bacterium]MDR7563492.1 beta-ketoacyl-ACP synthase III [Armatimonadota bacterium]MDR7567121.1 beta-ketoacyl-ACP synthase III [Armatimonadota bacterium]
MAGSSRIVGVGCCVPDRVLTNADLERMVNTTDEWITARTGIRERRVAREDQATSDLALEAAREALRAASVSAEDLDLILVGTATPDAIFPATGCILQDRLGARAAAAVDISAACSSFMYAMAMAHAHIVAGLAQRVLVVGADVLSRIVNWKDRATCVLFGDAAGAVVLVPSEGRRGILSFWLGADGSGASLIAQPAGGSRLPASRETVEQGLHYLTMNGREVFKFATRVIPRAIEEVCRRARVDPEEVDLFIPHQANIRIIQAAAQRLGQPLEKFFVNVDRYGNTSAASVPVALYEAVATGRLRPGDLAVLVAFGAGLTWGACALRWG